MIVIVALTTTMSHQFLIVLCFVSVLSAFTLSLINLVISMVIYYLQLNIVHS